MEEELEEVWDEVWKELPVELYCIIKEIYLKRVETNFRYHLAHQSWQRRNNTWQRHWRTSNKHWRASNNLQESNHSLAYWEIFYDRFTIKEIMERNIGWKFNGNKLLCNKVIN